MAIQKIPNTLIADNAVTAAKIANGTLTADDIAANSITGAKISATTSLNLSSLEIGSIQTTTNFPLIVKSGTNNHAIAIEEASGGETWQLGVDVDGDLGFYNSGGTTASVTFDDSGNVLVGTDSGDAFNTYSKLRIQNANHAYLQIKSNTDKQAGILLGDTDDDFVGGIIYDNNTNYLAFNSNNEERMRIASSGNVLIDCSLTSGAGISDGGFLFRTDTSSHRYMQISTGNTGDADVLYVYKKNGTGITGVGTLSTYGDGINLKGGNGLVSIGYGQSNFVEFLTSTGSGQPRARPSADGTVNLGDSSRRFKDLYLSGGVYLGGTGSVNKLDDYEEGTWTPSLQRTNGGQISAVYSTSPTGTYTKIGRLVHITIVAGITSVSSQGSGYAYLTGLPFAYDGNSYEQYLPMTTNTFGSTVMTAFYPSGAAGYFGTGISSTGFPPLQVSWTAGTLRISGVYKTT